MNVLQICNDFFNTRLYSNLFNKLKEYKVNNMVFIAVNNKAILHPYEKNVFEIKCFNSLDRLLVFTKGEKSFKAIINKINLKEIDIVHAHTLFSNGFIAYLIKKNYNIPYIVAIRNTDVNVFFKYGIHLRSLGIQIMKNAERIIFLSDAYRTEVGNRFVSDTDMIWFEQKSLTIPNGIDEYWIKNILTGKEILEKEKNDIRLVIAGEINKNKNQLTVIKACEELISRGYNCKVDLLGKISDEQIFSELKKHRCANYLGVFNKEQMLELYRSKNYIFVMPSFTETFGLVYAEAMSQGIPAIYTRGQGFDKQFEDGEIGFCVDPDNYIEIADRILAVKDKYSLLSNNCLKNVKKFDWDDISKRYYDIYFSGVSNYA